MNVTEISKASASRMLAELGNIPTVDAAPAKISLAEEVSRTVQNMRRNIYHKGMTATLVRMAVDQPHVVLYAEDDGAVLNFGVAHIAQHTYNIPLFRTMTGITKDKFSDAEVQTVNKFLALVGTVLAKPKAEKQKQTPSKILYGALQNLG